MRHRLLVLLMGVLSSPGVVPGPLIIRTGLNKDSTQKEGSSAFDLSSIKGIANYEAEEGFNRDNEHKHVKAQDSGNYGEQNEQKNSHANENNFSDDKFHKEGGSQVSDFGKKNARKKGHHKSGFHKSYHKDETASNSSFYDDEDDQGDEYVRDTKENAYGGAGQENHRGSNVDHKRYEQEQAKKGQYDNAGGYQKDQANQRDYNKKNYYDGKENEARRHAANQYNQANRYDEQNYAHRRPHHIDPYYYDHQEPYHQEPYHQEPYHQEPYHQEPYYHHQDYQDYHRLASTPKRTITIYEDPRYVDKLERYPRYDEDYVQLDIRRPPRDYPDYKYYERIPYSLDYY